ncbi:MAG: DUF2752 domain-containing protein [Flavobacterium sp.]|nr:DUF2752 domain-containing protein [Flavobacterium sp.]MDI9366553.1 DUF2752 domain-containing protein [Flavobacterium sp.]
MHTFLNFVVSYQDTIQWLKGFMLSCPSKKLLHIECPGCGFQRSFFALLEADFGKSWQLYPAMMPIVVLTVFTALHIKFQFRFGAVLIKYLFMLIAVVILTSYFYKIINHKIYC